MENLLSKLIEADGICKNANVHFEKANESKQFLESKAGAAKKILTKWIIIGVVIYTFVGTLLSTIPYVGKIFSLVVLAGSVYLGVTQYRKEKAKLDAELESHRKYAEKEDAAGQKIFEDEVDKLLFLPADYWYPMATEYLRQVVQTGRADDLKEALNMYDAQLHRWKVEEANAQIVSQQQAQTAHLKSIRRSSKVSAVANTANAFVNIASKF